MWATMMQECFLLRLVPRRSLQPNQIQQQPQLLVVVGTTDIDITTITMLFLPPITLPLLPLLLLIAASYFEGLTMDRLYNFLETMDRIVCPQ